MMSTHIWSVFKIIIFARNCFRKYIGPTCVCARELGEIIWEANTIKIATGTAIV
jgi:hypothetical protein